MSERSAVRLWPLIVLAIVSGILGVWSVRTRQQDQNGSSPSAATAQRSPGDASAPTTKRNRLSIESAPGALRARRDSTERSIRSTPGRQLGRSSPSLGVSGKEEGPTNSHQDQPQELPQDLGNRTLIRRQDVLKEREGTYGYFNGRYGVTFDAGTVDLGLPVQLEKIGQPWLSYTFESVRIGGKSIQADKPVSPQVRPADREVYYDRGVIEERYVLKQDAIEQLFVIRDLPEGAGPIELVGKIATSLTPPQERTRSSVLSFMNGGKEVISITDAVAIDARGRKISLELAYANERMTLSVPAEWVAQATLPIEIDPLIGGSITVDALAYNLHFGFMDAAYNTTSNEWLVVWSETSVPNDGPYDVFGQRVSATGALVGSLINIATTSNAELTPAVSYAPTVNKFLVVWDDNAPGWRIQGRLVSGAGVPDPSSFTVRDSPGTDQYPSVAFDGTNWYVVFDSTVSSVHSALGILVSTSGVPGATADPGTGADGGVKPKVAFAGGVYMVTWRLTNTYARTVNPTTLAMSSKITVASVAAGNLGISSRPISGSAGQFLITWQSQNAPNTLQGRILNQSAGFDTSIFNIVSSGSSSIQVQSASAYSGSSGDWLVVYSDPNVSSELCNLYGKRVTPTGTVSGTAEQLTSSGIVSNIIPHRMAWNPTTDEVLFVFNERYGIFQFSYQYRVMGQRYRMGALPGPSGFNGTAQTTSSILWSWSDIGGELGYYLHDSLEAVTVTTAANVTSASEGFLSENTQYTRHVHGYDGSGLGNPSASVTKATKVHDPAPGDITLDATTSTEIVVYVVPPPNWTVGLTACHIERSLNGSTWTPLKDWAIAAWIATDSGLTPATQYWYRVTYRNVDGVVSATSASTSGVTPPPPPPGPTGLTATALDSRVSLTWTGSLGATSYFVKRSQTSGGPYLNVGNSTSTTFVDDNLVNGIVYFYVVTADNEGGESAQSNQVSITPVAPGAIPALLVAGSTSLNSSDAAIKSRMESMGYSVTVKASNTSLQTSDANGKAIVVISSTTNSSNVNTKFRDITIPVLLWQHQLYDDMKMTGTGSANLGTQSGQLSLAMDPANASHAMAAGLTGTVQVVTASRAFAWGIPSSSAINIANVVSNSSRKVIFGYETGASMVGMNAPARRVGLFLSNTAAAVLNTNGWKLFEAALRWAAGVPTSAILITTVRLPGKNLILWDGATGARSYILRRATSPAGPFVVIATGLSSAQYEDTAFLAGQTNYYDVISVNEGGQSLASLQVQADDGRTKILIGLEGPRYLHVRTGATDPFWDVGSYQAQGAPPNPVSYIRDPGNIVGNEYAIIPWTDINATWTVDPTPGTTPACLTITGSTKQTCELTSTATPGTAQILYSVTRISTGEVEAFKFLVSVRPRQVINLTFRFPTNSAETRTQRKRPDDVTPYDFFNGNHTLANAARTLFVTDMFPEIHSILKQANIELYYLPEDATNPLVIDGFLPNNKFNGGTSSASSEALDALAGRNLTAPDRINIYLVHDLEMGNPETRGVTLSYLVKERKDRLTIVIMDPPAGEGFGQRVIAHEIGHSLMLDDVENLVPYHLSMLWSSAQINNLRLPLWDHTPGLTLDQNVDPAARRLLMRAFGQKASFMTFDQAFNAQDTAINAHWGYKETK